MYKPDDKDIDRLSREAAEHYRAPGEPSWDALQQILEKELPQEKEKKRRGFFFFFFLLLGILVAGAGVWYGLRVNTNNNTLTQTGKTTPGNAVAAAATASKADKNSMQPPAQPAIDATTAPGTIVVTQHAATRDATMEKTGNKPDHSKIIAPASTSAAVIKDKVSGQSPAVTPKDLQTNDSRKKNGQGTAHNHVMPGVNDSANEAVASAGNKRNTPARENGLGKSAKGASSLPEKTAVNTDAEKTSADKVSVDATVAVPDQQQQPPAVTTADTTAVAKTLTPPAAPAVAKDSTAVAKKKDKPARSRAINIGITGGFDKSTVKFTHGDNIGYNIGIMGGYQFSKHWSAYTGLIYTKKNYTLNGEDYHPPKHYWTQYVQLDLVDGYCRMWELPVQARYTFNPGAKTPFFASAGLSSYFMKKQGYTYYYKNNNMPYTADWTNDSTFNHVFSILNLSAGFEKRIGTHMNLQIEPYAKIPLGGVGFGNIRLSSYGINLTVQYRKALKR